MSNNNNNVKMIARVAKNKGIYQSYKKFIKDLKHNTMIYTAHEDDKDKSPCVTSLYYLFMNSSPVQKIKKYREYYDEYINDFTYDITEKISFDKSLELFKNFIIKEISENAWNNFLNYVSIRFINDNFIPYVKSHSCVSKHQVIFENKTNEEIIKQLPITCYLMHAFHWSETPQGNDFWRDLNDKWLKCLNEYIIEELYNKRK